MTPRYAPTSLPLARLTQTFNIHFYAEKQKLPLQNSMFAFLATSKLALSYLPAGNV
jgi:hypothetical protein